MNIAREFHLHKDVNGGRHVDIDYRVYAESELGTMHMEMDAWK